MYVSEDSVRDRYAFVRHCNTHILSMLENLIDKTSVLLDIELGVMCEYIIYRSIVKTIANFQYLLFIISVSRGPSFCRCRDALEACG